MPVPPGRRSQQSFATTKWTPSERPEAVARAADLLARRARLAAIRPREREPVAPFWSGGVWWRGISSVQGRVRAGPLSHRTPRARSGPGTSYPTAPSDRSSSVNSTSASCSLIHAVRIGRLARSEVPAQTPLRQGRSMPGVVQALLGNGPPVTDDACPRSTRGLRLEEVPQGLAATRAVALPLRPCKSSPTSGRGSADRIMASIRFGEARS